MLFCIPVSIAFLICVFLFAKKLCLKGTKVYLCCAVYFVAAAVIVLCSGSGIFTLKYLIIFSALFLVSVQDIYTRRVNDFICGALLIIGFIYSKTALYDWISLFSAIALCVFFVLVLKAKTGGGDLKLICAVSVCFGGLHLPIILVIGASSALLFGAARKNLRNQVLLSDDSIPFAVFISLGCFADFTANALIRLLQ